MKGALKVEVVVARERSVVIVELDPGATLGDAITAIGREAGDFAGYALHGKRAATDVLLRSDDRVELLEPLVMDPKEARRRRAGDKR